MDGSGVEGQKGGRKITDKVMVEIYPFVPDPSRRCPKLTARVIKCISEIFAPALPIAVVSIACE